MTRLNAAYKEDGEQRITLGKLDALSTLHVLVITKAAPKLIQYVYEDDPSALTEDVFLDACLFHPDLEVLKFLKARASSESYSPEKISSVMNERINEWPSRCATQLVILSALFPEDVLCPSKYHWRPNKPPRYPLQEALQSDNREQLRGALDIMAKGILHSATCTDSIKTFRLPACDDGYEASFVKNIMTFLLRTMVETFECEHTFLDSREFVECLQILFQATNMKTLELHVPGKEHTEPGADAYASFPLDCLRTCQVSNLSLYFDTHNWGAADFGMFPLLMHMQQLKTLTLQIQETSTAVHGFCESICQILALGRLESLTVKAAGGVDNGLFFPVLAAVSATPTLTEFQLLNLGGEKTTGEHIDRMVQLLESNTTLKTVDIDCNTFEHKILREKRRRLQELTRLNKCGRGLARDSGKASDMVEILAKAGEHYNVFTKLQVVHDLYGLLRESPGIWSADVLGQDPITHTSGRGLKRKAS